MALYWTSSGLQRLAQSESSGRADLIHYPSGFTSSGTRSSASGLYGFLDSTWREQAPKAGVDTSVYPRAYMAPAEIQTAVAAQTPISHWTCAGCNNVASNMAGNPQYVSTQSGVGGPVVDDPNYAAGRNDGPNTHLEFDDGSVLESGVPDASGRNTGTGTAAGGGATGTSTTNTGGAGGVGIGTPVTVGLQKGTIDNVTKWVNTNLTEGVIKPVQKFFAAGQNWFQRALIMIVALIILLVALWKLAGEPALPGVGAVGKLAKA